MYLTVAFPDASNSTTPFCSSASHPTVPSSYPARTRIRRFVFARTCIAISNRPPRRLWYSSDDSVSHVRRSRIPVDLRRDGRVIPRFDVRDLSRIICVPSSRRHRRSRRIRPSVISKVTNRPSSFRLSIEASRKNPRRDAICPDLSKFYFSPYFST